MLIGSACSKVLLRSVIIALQPPHLLPMAMYRVHHEHFARVQRHCKCWPFFILMSLWFSMLWIYIQNFLLYSPFHLHLCNMPFLPLSRSGSLNFGLPFADQGDLAFSHKEFLDYLKFYDISSHRVPSAGNYKNVLYLKPRVILLIFVHLPSSSPSTHLQGLVASAVQISSALYWSDIMSSFKLAKGSLKPLDVSCLPITCSPELVAAHETNVAKRKLMLMYRSNVTTDPTKSHGDPFDVYIKHEKEKRVSGWPLVQSCPWIALLGSSSPWPSWPTHLCSSRTCASFK